MKIISVEYTFTFCFVKFSHDFRSCVRFVPCFRHDLGILSNNNNNKSVLVSPLSYTARNCNRIHNLIIHINAIFTFIFFSIPSQCIVLVLRRSCACRPVVNRHDFRNRKVLLMENCAKIRAVYNDFHKIEFLFLLFGTKTITRKS